jgi:hypothetical protein
VGDLSLDYVNVRCTAEIQLPSMEGEGWLQAREESTET